MSSSNRRSAAAFFLCLLAACHLAGCGLIDLREIPVSIYPSEDGTVLPSLVTPLRVSFGAEVDRKDAEAAFSVSSFSGAVEGDIDWDGNGFSFVPASGWLPGVRYSLALSGSIRASDGRESRPKRDIAFFAVRTGGAPRLLSWHPGEGTSVGVSEEEGAYLRLEFSETMDARKTEEALSVQPSVDFSYSWNDSATVLTAVPRAPLSPCSTYRWKLSTGAAALDGAPLAREASLSFAADADAVPPSVARTFAAIRSGSAWVDSGGSLADLDAGQAVGIEFSEAMAPDSLLAAVAFTPSLSGRTDAISATTVVFIPDRVPEPETETTLIVSADVRDRSGLGMGSAYRERFVPAVPYLRVLSIETGGFEPVSSGNGSASPVAVSLPDGTLSLAIRFSVSFDAASRVAAAERIELAAFFPAALSAPSLRSASWTASDTVVLAWEGLERSSYDRKNWYLLTIP